MPQEWCLGVNKPIAAQTGLTKLAAAQPLLTMLMGAKLIAAKKGPTKLAVTPQRLPTKLLGAKPSAVKRRLTKLAAAQQTLTKPADVWQPLTKMTAAVALMRAGIVPAMGPTPTPRVQPTRAGRQRCGSLSRACRRRCWPSCV